MFDSSIEEIKNRLDIVEIIGGYIRLQKAGGNYRALCPFHNEKTPSFMVSPSKQIWHCFGCLEGGSIFDFVMKIEGIDFGEALKILASRAGIVLKRQNPKLENAKERLYKICELAAKFFEKQLEGTNAGKMVYQHLREKRGFSREAIKEFRIGYAPRTWQGLSDFLISRGFKSDEVVKAGLAVVGRRGNLVDRFRARIMFPISDLAGRPVGFGGRIIEGANGKEEGRAEAKYLNTPNTLIYDKSRVLYGLDKAKQEIRKKDEVILVEGYTDLIASFEAGVKNVVATSGTALSGVQLNLIKRYSQNIITAFDMDLAGDNATKRGIELAKARGFEVKISLLPQGKDPADCVKENKEDWIRALAGAKEIVEFYFENTLSRFDKNAISGKKEIAKVLLPVIKKIPNRIEQAYYLTKLAEELKIKEEVLARSVKDVKIKEERLEVQNPAGGKKDIGLQLEERLLALCLMNPEKIKEIGEGYFSDESLKDIFRKIKELGSVFSKNLEGHFEAPVCSKLNTLLAQIGFEKDYTKKELEQEIRFCIGQLETSRIKKNLKEISLAIGKAEESGDEKKVIFLSNKFNVLSKKLADFSQFP